MFHVNGVDSTLTLPAGTYIQFSATGASLDVLGQHLAGDFTFTKGTGDAVLTVANGSLSLAGGLVSVTGVNGTVSVGDAGVTSSTLVGTVAVSVPGVQFGGNVTVALETAGATRFVRVTASGVDLTIGAATLHGTFTFEQTTGPTGDTVVGITASGVTASLGGYVVVSDGAGSIVIGPDGISSSFAAKVTLAIAGFPTAQADAKIDIDTTPAGSLVRVEVTLDTSASRAARSPGRSSSSSRAASRSSPSRT